MPPHASDEQQTEFARAMLKECEMLRPKVSSCRIAWDKKDFDYLLDALKTLRELHIRWASAFSSFRRLVKAPFDDAIPMERSHYEVEHLKWLSSEMDAWRSLFPMIRCFAKRRDPKSILGVQKLLRSIDELQVEVGELAKTANAILDPQMMEYFNYHPPQIVQTI